jgi:rod shape determining protein RodA
MKSETIDYILYFSALLLTIFGVVVIYSITYATEGTKNYFEHQLVFAGMGVIFMILFSFLDYRFLRAAAYPVYLVSLILLLFLFITPLGKSVLGSTRWLSLGFFQFQPSELFKLVGLLMVVRICDQPELNWRHFILALIVVLLPVILVLKQPDFGTALMLAVMSGAVIFSAGFKKTFIFILVGILILFLLLFVLSFFKVQPFARFLKDYQRQRIEVFLNPQKDPQKGGYNVSQSIIAVGSGGVLGRGLGYGSQSQLNFIPSKYTDFIFAVAGEAFGFVGGTIMLGLFFVLILRILKIARLAQDNYGTLLCFGIATYFIFEVLINVGMTIGLMPVTGIPLPFVSYGGTSLWVSFIAIGICQSIMIRHKKINFEKGKKDAFV